MRARSVVIIVLLILALTVVAQNTQVVTFQLFFWTLTMSRVLLLAGALVVGMLIGLLLGRPWKKRRASYARVSSQTRSSEDSET
jgi:uncharacterized integral membrane protein